MKKLFLVFLILAFTKVTAQSYIEAVPLYKWQTKEQFSNEWQYVSTDLFLLNGDQFTYLIRNVNPTQRKKRWKKKQKIQNLLVTAELNGLKGFENITYPIFNFQIQKDENGDYQVKVSENAVLRLIDNFPVSSIDGHIETKIKVKVFTDENKKQLYKFVAAQLQNISNLANPTEAAMSLIGEFGKLLEKDAAGEQYEFESTIRVYEDENFNKRFHSLTIFVFKPSQGLNITIDTTKLNTFLRQNSNPVFDKKILRELIDFYTYPVIVAVNYRSKYIPKIPDEVSFESLKARSVKNESDFKNGLISQDIYVQEKNLIDFLTVFAQLKLDVNNYELDYKAKITDDYSIELFIILQDFWKLKNTFKTLDKANKGNPLYDNEFRPIYDMFLTKAELYLEGNASLRNIKDLVNLLYTLENQPDIQIDSAKREEYLQKLYSVELPKRELYSEEAKTIRKWISILENKQYYELYQPQIDYLSTLPVNDKTYEKVKNLQTQISNSACKLCREKVSVFITSFYEKYDKFLYAQEQHRFDSLKIAGKSFAFKALKNASCYLANIDTLYSGAVPDYLSFVVADLQKIKTQAQNLLDIINNDNPQTFNELKTTNNTIESLMKKINSEFVAICSDNKDICNCKQQTDD